MRTILEYKKRFFNLLESKSGDVKPLINEGCGNVVPLAKSLENLTITTDGDGNVIVGGKQMFSASSDEIVGEQVDINQIKNEGVFKPGDYVLNQAKGWGWLVSKTNGSWNGYIIKGDEIKGIQPRCPGYTIAPINLSIDKNFNIIGLTNYSIHKINFSNAKVNENKIIDINDKNLESIPQIVITSNAPEVTVVGGQTTFKLKNDYSGTLYQVDFSNTLMGVNLDEASFVSTYMDETTINDYFNGLDVKKGSVAAGFYDKNTETIYWVYTDTKGTVLKHVWNNK